MAQPYRDEEGRCPYDHLLREGQVHCELTVVDPSNQCAAHLATCSLRLKDMCVSGCDDSISSSV